MKSSTLFERSRRRIIAAIMAVLALLFIATLIAIYAFSYAEVYDRNSRMLEDYAAGYQTNRLPLGFVRPDGMSQRFEDGRPQSAPYYAVLFDALGNVVAVENTTSSGYTSGELVNLARDAAMKGERSGLEGSLMFAVERTAGYTLVAFMDNTLVTESMGTLFRYTLAVGLIALVALFFVARWLAGRIVRPMRQAYEAQRRFISDAGHELKTPVAVMETNAEMLEREIGENKWLQNVRYENKRLGHLVNQLLELARTEEQTPSHDEMNLSRIVEAEVLSNEPVSFERGMSLSCDIGKNITVEGSEGELSQLVAILLDNALNYGVAKTEVRVVLARAGHVAHLQVSNAVSPDDIERLETTALFDRFARADESRANTDDETSTAHYGLGLAIARAIVDAHDGNISSSVDRGNARITFTVELPIRH